jgi:hypothetical protein
MGMTEVLMEVGNFRPQEPDTLKSLCAVMNVSLLMEIMKYLQY